MKLTLISIIGIILLFFTINIFTEIKETHYTLIKKIQNIEIRKYQKLTYVSYIPEDAKDRNNSFRNVAGYIFGNNETEKKIDMTSPVVIKLHNNNEMAFIMPKEYTLNNLPKPQNQNLLIYEEPANIKACITYSGYSNKKKESIYIDKLKKILRENNITHNNDFDLLVYNSPYQFYNRKNEIAVSINYKNMEKLENENIDTIYLGGG